MRRPSRAVLDDIWHDRPLLRIVSDPPWHVDATKFTTKPSKSLYTFGHYSGISWVIWNETL